MNFEYCAQQHIYLMKCSTRQDSEANYNKINPCEQSIIILTRSLLFETGGLINLATKS